MHRVLLSPFFFLEWVSFIYALSCCKTSEVSWWIPNADPWCSCHGPLAPERIRSILTWHSPPSLLHSWLKIICWYYWLVLIANAVEFLLRRIPHDAGELSCSSFCSDGDASCFILLYSLDTAITHIIIFETNSLSVSWLFFSSCSSCCRHLAGAVCRRCQQHCLLPVLLIFSLFISRLHHERWCIIMAFNNDSATTPAPHHLFEDEYVFPAFK